MLESASDSSLYEDDSLRRFAPIDEDPVSDRLLIADDALDDFLSFGESHLISLWFYFTTDTRI